MAIVADILSKKGTRVHCVSPEATVLEATQLMVRNRIGSLVVTEQADCKRVVGMFTERDVLTRIVGEQRAPASTKVADVMTANISSCTPETSLEEVGELMRERRIRHVPVVDSRGGLQGMVSIGDLNAWHADGQATEINHLTEYIHGRV
jgi:CBS domain-containing protein